MLDFIKTKLFDDTSAQSVIVAFWLLVVILGFQGK